MTSTAFREGVTIAIESLRANKVRAALTILGIVIGVATVMAMAAVIGGVRSAVTGQLEALGPKNFVVDRFDQTEIRISGPGEREPWDGKPAITMEEAELIEALPSIRSVAVAVQTVGEVKFGASVAENVQLLGRSYAWPDYVQGDFVAGRNFLPVEEARSAPVAVLNSTLAEAVFGGVNPVGEYVRLAGERFRVVGVYRQAPNIFSSVVDRWAIVPPSTAVKRLDVNEEWLSLLVVPASTATQDEAIDDVTTVLRAARGITPAEENNFAVMRQEAFVDLFDQISGVFFLVMLVLSSIGLMVGGVGVVAIMMISVTERTREIGVRKALGATRREILWQFLVESMTVTTIGGALGMLLGGAGALLLARLTPIPAEVPLWSVAAALGVSAVSGIGFGLFPANRASRLDPVEALRHE